MKGDHICDDLGNNIYFNEKTLNNLIEADSASTSYVDEKVSGLASETYVDEKTASSLVSLSSLGTVSGSILTIGDKKFAIIETLKDKHILFPQYLLGNTSYNNSLNVAYNALNSIFGNHLIKTSIRNLDLDELWGPFYSSYRATVINYWASASSHYYSDSYWRTLRAVVSRSSWDWNSSNNSRGVRPCFAIY